MTSFRQQKDIQKIIQRYLAGKATTDEIRFVEEYYKYLGKGENLLSSADEIQELEKENFAAVQAKITSSKKHRVLSFYKYASAAAILILLTGGLYFFVYKNSNTAPMSVAKIGNLDVLPGTDKAILTLADGSKVVLDDKTAENISDTKGVKISKTKDGQLIYTVLTNDALYGSEKIAFNTIQTPKGGQYQVVLPDGTKVWLNAASSLKYPEVFVGDQRKVELTGEAYFEVAKNKTKPFHVKMQNQDVEVIGTHFNINGYLDDQTIKTTLLEGSIRVSNAIAFKILKPGDQAIVGLAKNSMINISSDVDTNDETAWKNGLFQFNDADLKIILNQLERWYDIKIDYASIPNKRYNGMVPRKSRLSEVLKMLEKTGNIKFELLEDRQLKVISQKK